MLIPHSGANLGRCRRQRAADGTRLDHTTTQSRLLREFERVRLSLSLSVELSLELSVDTLYPWTLSLELSRYSLCLSRYTLSHS